MCVCTDYFIMGHTICLKNLFLYYLACAKRNLCVLIKWPSLYRSHKLKWLGVRLSVLYVSTMYMTATKIGRRTGRWWGGEGWGGVTCNVRFSILQGSYIYSYGRFVASSSPQNCYRPNSSNLVWSVRDSLLNLLSISLKPWLLCTSTSFWVLRAPKSWLKHIFET